MVQDVSKGDCLRLGWKRVVDGYESKAGREKICVKGVVKTWAGKEWGKECGQNLGGKRVGERFWSKPGREKSGGKILVKTWAGKKWGKDSGQNLGGTRVGERFWSRTGREKSGGKILGSEEQSTELKTHSDIGCRHLH